MTAYRCEACGNKTRFDVFETTRARRFFHYTLGGDVTVDEEEILDRSVERVVCRWCGAVDAVVEEDRPAASVDAANTLGEDTG